MLSCRMQDGGDRHSKEFKRAQRERAELAVELHLRGTSYLDIGNALGLTKAGARQLILREIEREARYEPVSIQRHAMRIVLGRLDRLIAKTWTFGEQNPSRWLECARTIMRADNLRAEILGLKKIQVKVEESEDKVPLNALRALLARAEAVHDPLAAAKTVEPDTTQNDVQDRVLLRE